MASQASGCLTYNTNEEHLSFEIQIAMLGDVIQSYVFLSFGSIISDFSFI